MDDKQQQPQQPPQDSNVDNDEKLSRESFIKLWSQRIKDAKAHWSADFDRMRENIQFAAGMQWPGQDTVTDKEGRYICNLTLREVSKKVADLYAKNPEFEVQTRKRMEYELWDGTVEMLNDANMAIVGSVQQIGQPDPIALAIVQDFARGQHMEMICKRVAKTLETAWGYQVDYTKPDFKEMVKDAVLTCVTTGVAYCRLHYVREEPPLTSNEKPLEQVDRAKAAMHDMAHVEDDKLQPHNPQMEQMRTTVQTMLQPVGPEETSQVKERIEFDFPPPFSVIPDPRCRSLKEFINARWVVQEYLLPIDDANAFFGLTGTEDEIKPGVGGAKTYEPDGEEEKPGGSPSATQDPQKKLVCLWEVFDAQTKTSFVLCDGHKKYVRPPAPPFPSVSGFFPIYALTFNKHVADEKAKVSIYPQSDVQLIRDAQKEWNRTRDALRGQRNANAPRYLYREGTISEEDVEKIINCEPNEAVALKSIPPEMKLSEAIVALQVKDIDEKLYDTTPLEHDIQLSAGQQQANLGPAQSHVTATVGAIAEQSRASTVTMNIDDLDGWLRRMAEGGGEMMLQAFQEPNIKQIVGQGAVWPQMDRQPFLDRLFLSIKAASSGKPNKAVKVANAQQLSPIMLSAGANPVAVIEYLVTAMDDNIDPQKFFPLPGQSLMVLTGPQPAPQQAGPRNLPNGAQPPSGPRRPNNRPAQGTTLQPQAAPSAPGPTPA